MSKAEILARAREWAQPTNDPELDPVDPRAIKALERLLESTVSGLEDANVVPTGDGGISLGWQSGDRERLFQLEIAKEGGLRVWAGLDATTDYTWLELAIAWAKGFPEIYLIDSSKVTELGKENLVEETRRMAQLAAESDKGDPE